MRVLVDVVHPAHVHFYKNVLWGLVGRGHKILIVARDKDVTCDLLDRLGFDYVSIRRARGRGRIAQFWELIRRDWAILRLTRQFRPDLILTRSPAGAQVARLTRTVGVFDTDDGRAAGVHFRAAAPFAHYITTPDCFEENYGYRHLRYKGYKQHAYLHVDHYSPDPSILEILDIKPNEVYFVVRLVAMEASHDIDERGLSQALLHSVVNKLRENGRVFVTREHGSQLSDGLARIKVPPERLHDVLAFASLLVGDSATMAAEAAVLGTQSVYISTFAGRLPYLVELEQKYRLTKGFQPDNHAEILDYLDQALTPGNLGEVTRLRHARLQKEKENVAAWYIDLVERIASGDV